MTWRANYRVSKLGRKCAKKWQMQKWMWSYRVYYTQSLFIRNESFLWLVRFLFFPDFGLVFVHNPFLNFFHLNFILSWYTGVKKFWWIFWLLCPFWGGFYWRAFLNLFIKSSRRFLFFFKIQLARYSVSYKQGLRYM